MPSFALFAEGITDQVVLEKIIKVFYKGISDTGVVVNCLQPTRDATDVSRQQEGDYGGWQQVLEHCSISDNLHEAFSLNDYVVVHLDSDVADSDCSPVDPTQDLEDIVIGVEQMIIDSVEPELLEIYSGRFILAVAVQSTDCWLLPLFTNIAHERTTINSCEGKLGMVLRRSKKYYKKDGPCYLDLVKEIKKRAHLTQMSSCSPSLTRFLEALPPA
ncbi:hypothetical protein [Pseudomonas sp. R84]|uniref:hypothetical protein n=1 Tax=Pseudomonas sp. R84 TaxID=1573712 RepID=UPI00135942A2|nr:hypothetical protein [Pseudomonas sp. R84]